MKRKIFFLASTLFCYTIQAQVSDYKVVFDMSTRDSISQMAVIREIDIIKSGNPDAKLEVVIYGQGMNLVLKDKSIHPTGIQKSLGMKDVSFKICSITLKRNNVDISRLIPGVEVVPDGIYEIISKQKEGWGYIKVAH